LTNHKNSRTCCSHWRTNLEATRGSIQVCAVSSNWTGSGICSRDFKRRIGETRYYFFPTYFSIISQAADGNRDEFIAIGKYACEVMKVVIRRVNHCATASIDMTDLQKDADALEV